ncbi:DUF4167 domain-containing protein [Croceibacterium ferulae]|uniref:DUF4167 domain-containing protein n=1 Tax=Croceibacterium ferulae TaxID=1854641 RepID=UPI001F4D94F0|nr:DUF4167 domain-containing protein [Croceibacterium ferulae]
MNTNRNNNRRRGRNNSGRGQSGGGNGGGNRIDSRARGNAPQLLEKYRKLAHDASLNDDRVQTEYYLQFADHYFRVLADSKQKDDTRPRNQNDRGQSFDDYEDDEDEFDGGARATPRGRSEQGRDSAGREMNRDAGRRNDTDQNDGQAGDQTAMEHQRGSEGDAIDPSAEENPFTRDNGRRGRKPRAAADGDGASAGEGRGRGRPAASDGDGAAPGEPRGRGRSTARRAEVAETQGEAGFDAMVLPPSISRSDDAGSGMPDGDSDTAADAPPARAARKAPARPRRRAPRADDTGPEDGSGETLEVVG